MTTGEFIWGELLAVAGIIAFSVVLARLFQSVGRSGWAKSTWLIPIIAIIDRVFFFTNLDGSFTSRLLDTSSTVVGIVAPFLPAFFAFWLLRFTKRLVA